MFLERRVYQGSSGRVYPLPFIDGISQTPVDHSWEALHIENEFLRVMILPELGGRIHVAVDKTNGYDIFYRNNVIKPALVGLAGPWISGGVEFNWPQHHRPSTFMPTDWNIETHPDGSMTVWCSEHEPMNRMKGMHGICLHPGRSVIELKVRLYNRTELVQSFLWWANVAVRVHEKYQSFFPPDVHDVADHAKRAMSRFPLCEDKYYGVPYGERAKNGVPDSEKPTRFVPPAGMYAANDISWYANIPVPTSYMAMGSKEDFFGGYDHAKQAGFVHVANHHIAPGKKQWTWGNQEFGYAWDRNLTDDDGPYIELMAGVFTDNQPDFSFLHPGETRSWSQYWYPIQKIGPVQKANVDAAISLVVKDGKARVGIAVTREIKAAGITIEVAGRRVIAYSRPLNPGEPILEKLETGDFPPSAIKIRITEGANRELISYQPAEPTETTVPDAAKEPPAPADVQTLEQLYLIGLHLEQYRHATRLPELYWREALKRDPTDSRCNNAMGLWHYRRGEFEQAEQCFRSTIATLTQFNPNPRDGEPFYNLGITLMRMERDEEAYEALYKATWSQSWQLAGFRAMAELDCRAQRWEDALGHLLLVLKHDFLSGQTRNLRAMISWKLHTKTGDDSRLNASSWGDRLNWLGRYLRGDELLCDIQVRLDLAWELAQFGFRTEALDILHSASPEPHSGTAPLLEYTRAYLLEKSGDPTAAKIARAAAKKASPDYCFPARLEEIAIFQSAIAADPTDARAMYYLGNLYYDRRRHTEAIALWEQSARIDPTYSVVWRNLGIGYFNILHDSAKAADAYDKAFAANSFDARLLYERDQLAKRMGISPARRLDELEKYSDLVAQRDDVSIELCSLFNQTNQSEKALKILESRHFQPWEGGEGAALGQHVRTHLLLGQRALQSNKPDEARRRFELAVSVPRNLGEARHLLANQSDVHYWLGMVCQSLGDEPNAQLHLRAAAEARGDFQGMAVRSYSEMTFYSALALRALSREDEAQSLLKDLLTYARELETKPASIDYFATSLPTMLLFEDDLQARQSRQARLMAAQAQLGLGDRAAAEAMLNQLLSEDPNNAPAADLISSIRHRPADRAPHISGR